jgi:HK97 family phage major capsid protein
MRRSQQLRQQRGALIDQGDAILNAATAANRALTADEATNHDGLLAQIEALNAEIARAERQEALSSESRQPMTQPIDAGDPVEDRAGAPGADDSVRTAWYASRFRSVPAGAEQIARELYREDYSALAFRKMRDYGRYLRTGEISDHRLARTLLLTPQQIVDAAAHGVTVAEIRATMIEGDDTLGGYLVPEDVRMDMIERLPGLTAVRPRANVITTSRDRVSFPRVTGGGDQYTGAVRVTWVDETPSSTQAATNATFGQLAIPIHTVMAHIDLSRNLLEDSAIDLGGYLSSEMTSASAIDEDAKFLCSAGTGTPEGVLLNTTTGGPNNADITTVNTGSAAALTADGLIAVPFGLPGQYRQSLSAAWVMSKATHLAARQLKDGMGRYLWANNNDPMTGRAVASLEGFPIAESESMPAIGANNYPIIFADWKAYMIADRVGMSMERVTDATLAKQNLVSFVMRRRLGGQVTHGFRVVVQKCSA